MLESVSHSNYILKQGGPVIAGKLKDQPPDYTPVVIKDTKKILLWERLKY